MHRVRIHPSVALVIFAACALTAAVGGADFGRYRQWAVALAAGDIFLLQSTVGSPLGIPVTHWSPGPGMLFALPGLLLDGVVDPTIGALVAGWLAMLPFWWAFYRVLRWASRGDLAITVLGLGAAFLGTHVGFFSRAHASESAALALVALLVASVVDPHRGLAASSWMVGCCTALLIMTRSHYAVYALPALLAAGGRISGLRFRSAVSTEGAAAPRWQDVRLSRTRCGTSTGAHCSQPGSIGGRIPQYLGSAPPGFGLMRFRVDDAGDPTPGSGARQQQIGRGNRCGTDASPWLRAVGALLLLVPVAIAVIEQAFVNRWMTGSAMSSPYVFGDASFRSVNWLDPLFVPVLLHPWHGLLVYHPLYTVALVAAVVCALRSPSRRERILWIAALVAVVANLWVQAAWYAWWLGTATFGMRGMAPAAILLVAALARVIGGVAPRESPRRFAVRGWVAVTLACCLWSSLLLLQGTSQFYTWQEVLAGQSAAIGGLLAPRVLGSVAAAAAIVLGGWLWARRSARLANPITVRSHTGGHAEPWVAPAAVLLASLSLAYLMLSAQPRWTTASRSLYLPAVLLLVLVGIIFVALRLAGAFVSSYRNQRGWIDGRTRPSSGEHSCLPRYSGNAPLDRDSLPESPLPPDPRPPDAGRLSRSLARLAVTLWFVLSCFLFARLALITERRLAAGDVPDRGYRYAASFDVQNALTGLREYQRIDGFDDRKEALRRFLEAHGARLRR